MQYILPSKLYLRIKYLFRLGQFPNFKNPTLFTEKLQILKLAETENEHTIYADKVRVRNYVKDVLSEDFLIPILWVGDNPNKIPFSELPSQYIIKTNNGSGGNIVVDNKSYLIKNKKIDIDYSSIINTLKQWLKINYYYQSKEICYKNIKPQVLIEPLLNDEFGDIYLTDYKIHCFNGKAQFLQIIFDRSSDTHENWFDRQGNFLDLIYTYPNNKKLTDLPDFSNLFSIADKLSSPFKYVRVDLYSYQQQIYFGELTFYPGSGMDNFNPPKWNKIFGDYISLSESESI